MRISGRGFHWIALVATAALGAGLGGARAQDCAAELPASCLSKLSAGAAAIAADVDCAGHFERYTSCLAGLAQRASGGRSSAPIDPLSNAQAKEAYDDAMRGGRAADFRDVAELFPRTYWGRKAAREAERLAGASGGREPLSTATAPREPEIDGALHRDLQAELKRLGDYTGVVDGVWGGGSSSALRAFQRREGLAVDGAPSHAVLASLRAARPAAPPVAPEGLLLQKGDENRWAVLPQPGGVLVTNYFDAKAVKKRLVFFDADRSLMRMFEIGEETKGVEMAESGPRHWTGAAPRGLVEPSSELRDGAWTLGRWRLAKDGYKLSVTSDLSKISYVFDGGANGWFKAGPRGEEQTVFSGGAYDAMVRTWDEK